MAPILLRSLSRLGIALAFGAASLGAAAQPSYPDKPVRIVVPYPPGGTADILGRLLAERLAPELGQPVLVENRAGGGTAIGARYVAGAPADGHTLFVGTSTSHAINPALQSDIGYDPVRDFTAVAAVAEVPYVIVSHPKRGFRTLKDLVSYARAHPGELNYSSAGTGSSNHLGGELLGSVERIRITHIPYKGSAPALNDLLAGQVDFMFDLAPTAQQHVRAGRLTALAVTAAHRSAVLPDVPTTAEAGVPGAQITAWFGVFAPAGLPAGIQQRLAQALTAILAQPDTRKRLADLGTNPMAQQGAAFQSFVARDYAHWKALVAQAGIKAD
ncbi:MAG: Bug family tripartite tricarboxylate transporter substrate binding protein [Pigmentiphaga sp.]|uniref:Bug family tripartite tricarboxylate transporter substrate binding protein n=1 Tax=Pigmentiphaga sp. TaxID=1977564 RepID=UPI003B556125